ncbi:hypothetical protein GCM10028827_40760 [Mucilaginibacter myungsuensis]
MAAAVKRWRRKIVFATPKAKFSSKPTQAIIKNRIDNDMPTDGVQGPDPPPKARASTSSGVVIK